MNLATFSKYAIYLLVLALLAVFLIAPIALTVKDAFIVRTGGTATFTVDPVLDIFNDPAIRTALVNSLLVAVVTTFLCIVMALPLASLSTRYHFPGRGLFSALLLLPLILPPFVGAIGLRAIIGRTGTLNSLLVDWGWVDPSNPLDLLGGARFWGVVIAEALHLYPIVYLNVTAAMANLDPAMEQAAENLGAGRWTRFRRIVLPLILPGLFAGSTIVFIWSFTELGTPLMFDYTEVAPVQIFWGIQDLNSAKPFALVVVVLAISSLLYLLGKVTLGRKAYAATTRASVQATPRQLGWGKGLLALLPFAVVTGLAILPHIGVVLASITEPGAWYRTALPESITSAHFFGEHGALAHPLASNSIKMSLVLSCLSMAVDIVLGLTIAYLVVRCKVFGSKFLDALAMLPLAVPGLVMAFGYVAMSQWVGDWFTARGWETPRYLQVMGENPNPMLFLVIAYAVRRLPYVVRSASAGLEQTPIDLEEAAAVLGESKLGTIRRIVMPLIAANLIAGGLLAFSFAMLEVSDSLILAQTQQHYPITKAIYELFGRLGDGPYVASAMGVWGMVLLSLTLIGASLMLGRKMGAIFRI